jgi:hypothetical protein
MNCSPKCSFLLLLCLPLAATAQDTVKIRKNAIYMELTDWGTTSSVSYDRVVRQAGPHRWGLRAGLSVGAQTEGTGSPFPSYRLWSYTAGATAYYLRGAKNHHLELGLGYYWTQNDRLGGTREWETYPTYQVPLFDNVTVSTFNHHLVNLRVGYRYQRPKRGIMFRAGLTPLTLFLSDTRGFGVGYTVEAFMKERLNRSDQTGSEPFPRLLFLPIPDLSLGWSF